MAPDRICELLGQMSEEVLEEIARVVRTQRGTFLKKNKTLMYFDPGGLADLRAGGDFESPGASVSISAPNEFLKKLTTLDLGYPRLAVLDLYQMILDLIMGVAAACDVPDSEEIKGLTGWAFQE